MGKMKIKALMEDALLAVDEDSMADFERFLAESDMVESDDYRFDCECLGCTGEDIEGA
jgi:hypothetical protein